ncbi:biotin transporter BioY [Chelatococcus asaccharovorans]|uniref:Biotin transporter n=1 Tax=Chelatococcus asaccharovorans TaxID=28210 RepID=A0A2V3U229_9HYPH|nr:biotin transporter BioY [Chelatococcus asaccharovorans]MBS7702263.1 biotin transporter BioY [Chelatococcus asaccharovorans]PXW56537.1 biotin transport system substrate-specific component [Chelatococcus asaccharovorans]
MTDLTASGSPSPLLLQGRSRPVQLAAVALGTLFLAISSQIAVPMVPVPVTMQTFAVTLVGAIFGWRMGALTVLAWLAEAMIGLPVLAGGASGIAPFVGPTAGYLLAFPLMAAGVGVCAERGWLARHWVLAFAAMLAANLFALVLGTAWLAGILGLKKAIAVGATPFLIGAVLKSALAAALVTAGGHFVRARRG